MAEHALGQGHPCAHQEGWPIDRVEASDILADHVHVGRPIAPHGRGFIGEADAGQVIVERVDPDVHDVAGRIRHGNAPIQRRARYRQIFQAALDERHDLVAPLGWLDELWMRLVVREQSVLVFLQSEEERLLLGPLDRRTLRANAHAIRTDGCFGLVVIGLVAHGIPTGVTVEIDIAGFIQPLPQRRARTVVLLFGRADETVVRQMQRVGERLEARGVAVGEFAHRHALLDRGLLHLQAVLVGAGQKEHVIAVEPLEAGDGVGRDRLVGVADVGYAVRVGDGSRDVERRPRLGGAGLGARHGDVRSIEICGGASPKLGTRRAKLLAQMPQGHRIRKFDA